MQIPHSAAPHGNEAVLVNLNGVNPTKALVLLHGRGATAEDIMGITADFRLSEDVLVLAPQAAGNTWYPERFIMPQNANQPDLDSAIERISTLVKYIESKFNIPAEQIVLAGFSQGACLVAEYLKRNPKRYRASAIYSGGLIGDEVDVNQTIEGSFDGTPIYIGCDKEDFHIPNQRVITTATYLSEREAVITLQLYTNLGHTIHAEGLQFIEEILR